MAFNAVTHLNKQLRMASPFSCDKILVFVPSVKSHNIIVPSTDAEHKTPPLQIKNAHNRLLFWHRRKENEPRSHLPI